MLKMLLLLVLVLLLGVAGVAGVTWGPLDQVEGVVRMKRGSSGGWEPKVAEPAWHAVSWGDTETDSGSTRVLSVPGKTGGLSPFHASRVWILSLDPGPLSRSIGRAIQADLAELPGLLEVHTIGAEDLPLRPENPPHLFVTIKVLGHEEEHLPWSHSLETEVQIYVGVRPLATAELEATGRNGPRLQTNLTFQTETDGFVSQSARYRSLAEAAVEHLDLAKEFDAWQQLWGKGEGLPSDWSQTAPSAPEDLPLVDDPSARLLVSMAPPLHEEQVWVLSGGDDPLARVEAGRRQLEADGWKVKESLSTMHGRPYYLAAALGDRMVELYEPLHEQSTLLQGQGQRHIVVAHQRSPSVAELRTWLETSPRDGSQQPAIADLLRGLRLTKRLALQSSLKTSPLSGRQDWILEVLR